MNFSLASNIATLAKSLSSTLASATTPVATAAKSPATATQLPTTDVLRSAPKSDLSAAQWHSDSLAERGIIIVSGKNPEKSPISNGNQSETTVSSIVQKRHEMMQAILRKM